MKPKNPNLLKDQPTTTPPTYECSLCHRTFTGYPNNPEPLLPSGQVCNQCNIKVIQARIQQFLDNI